MLHQQFGSFSADFIALLMHCCQDTRIVLYRWEIVKSSDGIVKWDTISMRLQIVRMHLFPPICHRSNSEIWLVSGMSLRAPQFFSISTTDLPTFRATMSSCEMNGP